MSTSKTLSVLVLLASVAMACSAEESEFQKPTGEEWSSLSSQGRATFLDERLVNAADALEAASTQEEWDLANEEIARSLSLLRAELWATERDRYIAREAELEALATQTRP